jgi:hypothetical protein
MRDDETQATAAGSRAADGSELPAAAPAAQGSVSLQRGNAYKSKADTAGLKRRGPFLQ